MPEARIWCLSVTLVTVFWAHQAVGDKYCYATTPKPYLLTGTKTDYISLPNKRLTKVASTSSEKCKPVMVWMMAKHGATWPNSGEMNRYFSHLEFLQNYVIHSSGFNNLCKKDQELFKSWTPRIPEGVVGGLHPTGETGLRDMAQRVKRAFPKLFKKPYSGENYVIQYGKQAWKITYDSARAFAKGIFAEAPELMTYEKLDDHIQEVQSCKAPSNEPHQSPDGPVDIANIKPLQISYDRVKARLGTPDLESASIDTMFFACAQEKAWDPNHKSPWCTLLEPDDIKAQEYVDDVNYYYSAAYKDDYSKQVACPLVRDMILRFKMYAEKPGAQHPKGVFYFGLGKHVNVVTTALGMMFEKEYLGLNKINPQRKFRTSKFMGFQGNMIAVLNECSSTARAFKKSFKVKFFLNEVSVKEVKLENLMKEYQQYIDDATCNYDFCNQGELEIRQQYRQEHPNPIGVNPDIVLPAEEDNDSSSSSSSSDKKSKKTDGKKKGHPWYWYIWGFPFMVVSTCFTSFSKPFTSSSSSLHSLHF